VHPSSRFAEAVQERVAALSAAAPAERAGRRGVVLEPLEKTRADDGIRYRHLTLAVDPGRRIATLTLKGPEQVPSLPDDPAALGCGWYPLALFRELDDALVELRFNFEEIGLVLLRSEGDLDAVLEMDRQLQQARGHWLGREVLLLVRRTLKRLELTARTLFALVEPGSCLGGFLLETALAADRIYMQDDPETPPAIALTALNGGALPMGNGLSRLAQRFLAEPGRAEALLAAVPARFSPAEALAAGLVTAAPDELDWEDEVRLAVEERASLSPDALTAMEANLRFAGPETLETKIFGRLSAWQNWVFQRPNATGERGALTLYGEPNSPEFDRRRT
jgi:benzoyl-CoA-dihydrodiol lyase